VSFDFQILKRRTANHPAAALDARLSESLAEITQIYGREYL
jgi:hypothetical protein